VTKPKVKESYSPKDVQLVRSACLTLATYLGSFLEDLVVIGGLVPTLLIPRESLAATAEPHVGTQDLDLGLSLALLRESRYLELVEHLASAGFRPDVNSAGKPANHRWKHADEGVTVDFLIAPSGGHGGSERVRVIESHLSAVLAPGLPMAFRDRRRVLLEGKTLRGEVTSREVWVCGAGAFVVLKALAFRGRGENKDAYDLLYLLENFGESYVAEVAAALRPLLDADVAREAIAILRADFLDAESLGPRRAAEFMSRIDLEYRADRAAAVRELLRLLGES